MAVSNPLEAFIWGAGGAKKTPEEIAREKEIAAQMLMKAGNTSPVEHWTQGAARVADALSGVIKERRANVAGEENATYNQDLITNLLGGGKPASSDAVTMSGGAGEVAGTSPASGMQSYRDAIAGIESAGSGDYAAIGPTHDKLGRALGRYQIMEANIGPWSQAALGQAITPDQFMANPELQDKIFDHQFQQYVDKYGPEGAAQAWLGGEGGVGKVGRKDALGTSIGEYGNRFMGAIGGTGQEVAQATPGSLADEVSSFQQTPEYAAQFPGMEQQPAVAESVPATGLQEVAQALPTAGQTQQQNPAINEAIYRAIADPRATPETKAVAQALMQQQMARQQAEQEMRMKQADPAYQIGLEKSRLEVENLRNPRLTPGDQLAREKFDFEKGTAGQTNDIKEYEYAKQQGYAGSFADFQQSMKKAGAASTNVNVGEGNKFYEALDKKNAETFSALSEEGMRGRGKLAQIDRLEQLMATAPQGGIGALKLAAGEYGIKTDGLSDIQAAQALINELVPQQRQPGSGPMSDADLALFKQSLPRIINQPGGNQTILQTMRGITQYQIKMGEIADLVANREMSPDDARKAIRRLDNPLDAYTKAVRQMENEEQDDKASIPEDIDPEDWEFLTPEERKLFR